MNAIERAEQAARKTAERLRKAKLADADIRLRAVERRHGRLMARRNEITQEIAEVETEMRAISEEVLSLKEEQV